MQNAFYNGLGVLGMFHAQLIPSVSLGNSYESIEKGPAFEDSPTMGFSNQ